MDRRTLENKPVGDLRQIAKQLELTGVGKLRKAELIDTIVGEIDGAAADDGADHETDGGGSSKDATGGSDAKQARDEVIERRRARNRGGDTKKADASDGRGGSDRDRGSSRDTEDDAADTGRDDAKGSDDNGGRSRKDDDDNGRNRSRSRSRRSRGGRSGEHDDLEEREGVLDLLPEGYGFLRTTGYVSGAKDVYVSQSYVRRFNLRRGDLLGGPVRFNKGNDKFPALARLETCEGEVVENEHDPILRDRPEFEELTAVFPDTRLGLGSEDGPTSLRVLDAIAPMGRGQRALVTAPAGAGSTTLLRQLAGALREQAPDAHLLVVLVDERHEEVTEYERTVDAEIIASPFDRPAEDHTALAELAIERAKRMVERGEDVIVLLDSLTALARAYNAQASSQHTPLPGGVDVAAVHPAKALFGAARRIEDGGSLTVVATALTGGSPADDVIRDEFQGTATLELHLDPELERPGLFPGIDVQRSGTHRTDLLLGDERALALRSLRRELAKLDPDEAVGTLLDRLETTPDADDLLDAVG